MAVSVCEVIEKTELASGIYKLAIDSEEITASVKPGQFLHIRCGDGNLLRRPISVSDVNGSLLSLVFEVKGAGTAWLSARKNGDALDVLGPLGNGFEIGDGNIIVTGGGIGAPPLLYAAAKARGRVAAALGFRGENRMILTDEFSHLCDEVYITTDDGSFGIAGPVTIPLERLMKSGGYGAVLACGPRPMLKAVAELTASCGMPCQVSLEERMGCGVGACLVCACGILRDGEERMERVCKDGPVFDAREVIW